MYHTDIHVHVFNEEDVLLMYYTQNKKSINLIISVFLCNDLITRQQLYMARSPQPAARSPQPAARRIVNLLFRRGFVCSNTNRKSQKLSPLCTMERLNLMIYPLTIRLDFSPTPPNPILLEKALNYQKSKSRPVTACRTRLHQVVSENIF